MIPTIHRAGTTIEWSYTTPDYTSANGWTSTVHLTPPLSQAECTKAVELTATADGDTWKIDAPASRSKIWPPGEWLLNVEVTKGTDSFVPIQTTLRVSAKVGTTPADVLALQDNLKATDAAIAAVLAGQGIQEMTIHTTLGQRELSYMSLKELRNHRTWVLGEIGRRQRALGMITRNKQGWRRIRTYVK